MYSLVSEFMGIDPTYDEPVQRTFYRKWKDNEWRYEPRTLEEIALSAIKTDSFVARLARDEYPNPNYVPPHLAKEYNRVLCDESRLYAAKERIKRGYKKWLQEKDKIKGHSEK